MDIVAMLLVPMLVHVLDLFFIAAPQPEVHGATCWIVGRSLERNIILLPSCCHHVVMPVLIHMARGP